MLSQLEGGTEIGLSLIVWVKTPPYLGQSVFSPRAYAYRLERLQIPLPASIPCPLGFGAPTLPSWLLHSEDFHLLRMSQGWCSQCFEVENCYECYVLFPFISGINVQMTRNCFPAIIPLVKLKKMNCFEDNDLRSCHFRSYGYAFDVSPWPTTRAETWLSFWNVELKFGPLPLIFLFFFSCQTWPTSNRIC